MRLWLVKTEDGFFPADEASEELHHKFGVGECAEFTVIRPRSLRMHRRYFAICRAIGQNQEPSRDEDSVDAELRVLAGHYDVVYARGYEIRIPKRIAFHKLTHDDWMAIWPSLERAIIERFGEEYIGEFA